MNLTSLPEDCSLEDILPSLRPHKSSNCISRSAVLDEHPRPVSPKPGETRTDSLSNFDGRVSQRPAASTKPENYVVCCDEDLPLLRCQFLLAEQQLRQVYSTVQNQHKVPAIHTDHSWSVALDVP